MFFNLLNTFLCHCDNHLKRKGSTRLRKKGLLIIKGIFVYFAKLIKNDYFLTQTFFFFFFTVLTVYFAKNKAVLHNTLRKKKKSF